MAQLDGTASGPPERAHSHSAVASLNDGARTVTVPKSEAARPRHVEITG